MQWVTLIWGTIASACVTLSAIYFLVWYKNRAAWAHLFFSLTAVSTAGWAFCELWMMRSESVEELTAAIRSAQVPMLVLLVSITWFVWTYLGAGRTWLAWSICVLRALYVLPNFLMGQNPSFRELAGPHRIEFLGEFVTISGGVPNPFLLVGQFGVLLVLVFVADASVTTWRRGDRRKALVVGGSVVFFLAFGLGASSLVIWANVQAPMLVSPFFLGLVAVMGYELSHDVMRASQLVHDLRISEAGLRESEERMSLAVEVADFGIWTRELGRSDIWASDKWRTLFGFSASDPLDVDRFLERVHVEDRDALGRAQAMAVEGADGGTYQLEYRAILPDGTQRWIASRGRVERDATGRPVLMRGASRDITARKRSELAVHKLSGRLLSAQEEERRRIARELHDNLCQQMALLAIEIEQLEMESVRAPATVRRTMRHLGQRTAEISSEMHNMSHRLHSAKLDALGLVAAVRGHCHEIAAQGVQVLFLEQGVPTSLSPDVELCLFRIVQEALTNVVKHSSASTATVSLYATGDTLQLSVADNGCGFNTSATADRQGLGLESMRERLHLVDGELVIRSRAGEGTTIDARVPLTTLASEPAADGSTRVA